MNGLRCPPKEKRELVNMLKIALGSSYLKKRPFESAPPMLKKGGATILQKSQPWHGADVADMEVRKFRSLVREQAQLNYCLKTAAILASEYRRLPAVAIPQVTNLGRCEA